MSEAPLHEPDPAIVEAKRTLRRELLARRAALAVDARDAASVAIQVALAAMKEFRAARGVAGYLAMGPEAQVHALLASCWQRGVRVALPAIGPDRVYRLVWQTSDAALVRGPLGISQPEQQEVVDPAALDLILVPGVGFDRHGGRLGHGGGHYDRILAAHPRAFRCGVAFAAQVVDQVPLEATDVSMDAVITEGGMWQAASARRELCS